MKSKIAVLSCLAVAAMMTLPTVSASTMAVDAWTDDDNYNVGDNVDIDATWIVTDPNDFDHDKCHVKMDIRRLLHTQHWEFEGEYDVTIPEATGAFPVYCGDADGFASYVWDTTGKDADDYYVDVYVTSWDNSQTPPDDVIYGYKQTAIFTLN